MKNNFEGFELIKNDTFLNLTKEFYHENCIINNKTVYDITFIFPHKCIDEYFKTPIEILNKFSETFSYKEIVADLKNFLPRCVVKRVLLKFKIGIIF